MIVLCLLVNEATAAPCAYVLVNMIFLRHWTTFLTNRVRIYLWSEDMLAGSHNFIIKF